MPSPKKPIEPQTNCIPTTAKRSTRSRKSVSPHHPVMYVQKTNSWTIFFFLKSAWPDTKRKEPEIIKEAYRRAETLLGTEARSVTDHLPIIVNSRELAYTSTEIIRRLVGSNTTTGFRVQIWMLSKKLQPIYALEPRDFWKALWHVLRC